MQGGGVRKRNMGAGSSSYSKCTLWCSLRTWGTRGSMMERLSQAKWRSNGWMEDWGNEWMKVGWAEELRRRRRRRRRKKEGAPLHLLPVFQPLGHGKIDSDVHEHMHTAHICECNKPASTYCLHPVLMWNSAQLDSCQNTSIHQSTRSISSVSNETPPRITTTISKYT